MLKLLHSSFQLLKNLLTTDRDFLTVLASKLLMNLNVLSVFHLGLNIGLIPGNWSTKLYLPWKFKIDLNILFLFLPAFGDE